jgi:transcriptional regulator with XRE-family HTH domain
MPARDVTLRPFAEELPRLLAERKLTLRALAREVGGFDHAYLSRMLSGKAAPNAEHLVRIATHLGLRADYFPEVRTTRLINAIRDDPRLRDEMYFRLPPRKRSVRGR